jgi:D-tyrosyl-tRNA(Tyr) deacylase
MRVVVQRVSRAAVLADGEAVGRIDEGLLIYVGVETDDGESDAQYVADKVRHLRIFPDDKHLMNRDVSQAGGAVLAVSAFTTAADARKGRRPSFDRAATSEEADALYGRVCQLLEEAGLTVARGRFGAMMEVESINAGPVCILLDSKRVF